MFQKILLKIIEIDKISVQQQVQAQKRRLNNLQIIKFQQAFQFKTTSARKAHHLINLEIDINFFISIYIFKLENGKNMKSQIIIFCCLVLLALTQRPFPPFQQYVNKYQKKYSADQYKVRETRYKQKIAELQKIQDYEPAVNEMTDWSQDQINARKNLLMVDVNNRLGRPAPVLSKLGSPASYDWRDFGVITSVKSQGSCGGCWAFAAAAHAESKLIIQKRFTNTTINLSEQYLVSCTKYSNCAGGFLQYAMKAALKIPSQSTYPYTANSNQNGNICYAAGVNVASNNYDYYNVTDSQLIMLLLESPVAISISSSGWENYGSGIYRCPAGVIVDHAVQLVGYTADYWIVKNQWSPNWGQSGYMRITRNPNNNCGIGTSIHILRGAVDRSTDSNFIYTDNSNNSSATASSSSSATSTTLYGQLITILPILLLAILLHF